MPARKPRELKFPERKLRPVPARKGREMTKRYNLKNARFYYDLQGNMFSVQSLQPRQGLKFWSVAVSRISKGKLKEHAIASLSIEPGQGLEILNLAKGFPNWRNHTGQLLFRAVLNEAIRIAKRERENIWIETREKNDELEKYYKSFGFKFNDMEDPTKGLLEILKNGKVKQK